MKISYKQNISIIFSSIFVLTTSIAHGDEYYGATMMGGGIIDDMAIKEKNILEFTIRPDVRIFCYPPPHRGDRAPICKSTGSSYRAYAEGYRFMNIRSEDPDITFPDLTRLPSGTNVYKSNEYHRFEPMFEWSSVGNTGTVCDIRSTFACFVYSPTDTYRLRISASGKKDGIYNSTFEVSTYYNADNNSVDYAGVAGYSRTGTITYRVFNGSVVPPTTSVSCNFSHIYTDSSGTSSGTNILHSYGDMKPGATGSKKTLLVYSCDSSASSFTASLRNAAISVKKTTAGASEVATKTVINDGTGKLDVSLTGIKGPLPVYSISDNEFIIGFMSTLTAKSAGSIKYTDILVLSYD
ncbi:TPA: hypothetical protein ACJGUQ_003611 [Salmonella enterica subsp. enterica serovar Ball]